jgi:hypothetical protein
MLNYVFMSPYSSFMRSSPEECEEKVLKLLQ